MSKLFMVFNLSQLPAEYKRTNGWPNIAAITKAVKAGATRIHGVEIYKNNGG